VVQLGRELEQVPRLTSRGLNMWAGTLRELGDLRGSRELSEEALELSTKAAFIGAEVSARIDLLYDDIAEGNIGKGKEALPTLVEATEKTKGWHQWLWMGRLEQARAELALGAGELEEAADAAEAALGRAGESRRLKYQCLARTARGRAMVGLGRSGEAEQDFRAAVALAEQMGHVPSSWLALAGLAEALAKVGRDDEAEEATTKARNLLMGFAGGLSEDHRRSLESSPTAAALLASRS
jgi:tetratricopeptide (TPR) repeat protein